KNNPEKARANKVFDVLMMIKFLKKVNSNKYTAKINVLKQKSMNFAEIFNCLYEAIQVAHSSCTGYRLGKFVYPYKKRSFRANTHTARCCKSICSFGSNALHRVETHPKYSENKMEILVCFLNVRNLLPCLFVCLCSNSN